MASDAAGADRPLLLKTRSCRWFVMPSIHWRIEQEVKASPRSALESPRTSTTVGR